MHYDVTIITVRPGTEQKALARLKETLPSVAGDGLLACWYADIGALNRILLIRAAPDIMRIHEEREKILRSVGPMPASMSGRGCAQRRSRTRFGRRLAARII
jgi:hypothetical protein